jgi:hypothetical protein
MMLPISTQDTEIAVMLTSESVIAFFGIKVVFRIQSVGHEMQIRDLYLLIK